MLLPNYRYWTLILPPQRLILKVTQFPQLSLQKKIKAPLSLENTFLQFNNGKTRVKQRPLDHQPATASSLFSNVEHLEFLWLHIKRKISAILCTFSYWRMYLLKENNIIWIPRFELRSIWWTSEVLVIHFVFVAIIGCSEHDTD